MRHRYKYTRNSCHWCPHTLLTQTTLIFNGYFCGQNEQLKSNDGWLFTSFFMFPFTVIHVVNDKRCIFRTTAIQTFQVHHYLCDPFRCKTNKWLVALKSSRVRTICMDGNASMASCVGHAVEKGTAKDGGTKLSSVARCYLRQRTGLNTENTELSGITELSENT